MARTAVFNGLFARNQGGQFLLRVEDTDLEHSKDEYTQDIIEGMKARFIIHNRHHRRTKFRSLRTGFYP